MDASTLQEILRQLVWSPADHLSTDDLQSALESLAAQGPARLQDWAHRLLAAVEAPDPPRVALLAAQGLRLLAETPDLAASTTTAEEAPAELTRLRGCGPKTAALLAAAGLASLDRLAFFLPKGYEDLRQSRPLSEVEPGYRGLVEGVVQRTVWAGPPGRRHLEAHITDDEGHRMVAVWFQVPRGLTARLRPGLKLRLSGSFYLFRNRLQVAHPRLVTESEQGLVPIYPKVPGVGNARLRSLCLQAARLVQDDGVPRELLAELGLPELRDALLFLHDPPADISDTDVAALMSGRHAAQRRLILSEFFTSQLALALKRARAKSVPAAVCPSPPSWEDILPLRPTGAQRRAIREISEDLASGRPMLRLLQGDVGSGKTLVAYAAARQVLASGRKVAIMAPTEILANQQAAVFRRWLPDEFPVFLLTASTPAPVRRTTLAVLQAPGPALAVGTHALLAPSVAFRDLALVIIDEQHRFGVLQRHRLTDKSETRPHLLVMTATPIPRTMALALHGDLDLSVLDELPSGRPPVTTHLYEYERRTEAWAHLRSLLEGGHQCFVVCARREESDRSDLLDASTVAKRLRSYCPATGLLHGRMSPTEKERILSDFRQGRLQVLVATTVVEVGLDVPSAQVMVVLNAERFGLAQLHQLRGRVGRGTAERAECLLLAGPKATAQALERLQVLVETTDGFRIAERDLALRGPGDVVGTQQAGRAELMAAAPELLLASARAARQLVATDPSLRLPEHRILRERLTGGDARNIGPEAG